ncbi:hypothetical protein Btru_055236 [Bulinus truncatus]|nr:hypothetical protein Btru_055236 [Bulinus truncatus]
MAQEDDEWELSKENVQPLREGRCVKTLVAALHSDQEEHTSNLLREQQNEFELELRTYSGDDPFDVWYRYIKWTEQNFPKGGLEGQLAKLIERCLREFQANDKYLNDPRIIRLWIKFACYSDDPVDIYKYMFDNSIGVHVASFYIEWALAVERKGDMKTADQLYVNGLKLSAEPKELLVERHQQFQSRVAKNITLQIADRQNPGLNFGDSEEKRTTLGRLKPTGHSRVVGTTRTGGALLGAAGSLKDSRPSVSKQLPSKGIPVYCDNENASQPHLLQTHEWQSLPVKHIDNLENDKKPGVWTNAKVKQKPSLVPSALQPCPFQIHVDQESNEQPLTTPRKTTFISHTQPLSCHKAPKIDALSSVRQEPKESSNEVPMYQKDKIYNGLSEFSFEELRAIKYWKKKKEALRLQQEEEHKKTEEALRRQLQETKERLARVEAVILPMMALSMNRYSSIFSRPSDLQTQFPQLPLIDLQNLQAGISPLSALISPSNVLPTSSTCQQVTALASASEPSSLTSEVSNNQTPTNQLSTLNPPSAPSSLTSEEFDRSVSESSTNSGNSSHVISSEKVKRATIFNSLSTYSSLVQSSTVGQSVLKPVKAVETNMASKGVIQAIPADDPGAASSNKSIQSLESFHLPSGNDTLSLSSGQTPDSFMLKKKSLSAPSPTVCTKEALQCVLGMFSAPLTNDNETMEAEDEKVLPSTQVNRSVGSRRPLEICGDTTSGPPVKRQNLKSLAQLPLTDKPPVKGGLQVYCDSDVENKLYLDQPKQGTSTTKGLQIYQDEPFSTENAHWDHPKMATSTTKGLQIYQDESLRGENVHLDKPKLVSSSTKGLQIYQDKSPSTGNVFSDQTKQMTSTSKGLQIYQDKSFSTDNVHLNQPKPVTSAAMGLQIYQDKFIGTDTDVATSSFKKGARRGLAFSENFEMEEKTLHVNKDFTIMGQAISDLTLAPLESFTMCNNIASTPKVGLLSPLGSHWDPTVQVPSTISNVTASTVDSHAADEDGSFHKSGKILSPIIEGGEPGSSEESQASSVKCSDTIKTEKSACTRLESHQEQFETVNGDDTHSVLGGRAVQDEKIVFTTAKETLPAVVKKEEEYDIASLPVIKKENKQEKALLDCTCSHFIDTTAFIYLNDTSDELSTSIALDPRDPFDKETISHILNQLDPPLSTFPNYFSTSSPIPQIAENSFFTPQPGCSKEFYVRKVIGEGGYATVFEVTDINISLEETSIVDDDKGPQARAMKVQSPACHWEFYINCELRKRLGDLNMTVDVRPSIIEIYLSCFYKDASVFIMNFVDQGSLLDLVNKYKNVPNLLADVEPFAILMTIELLHLFEQIHKCEIIHGDVKPDNFLLMELPDITKSKNPDVVFGTRLKMVKLIDFGQSIDMRQFKNGATFTAKVVTSGFQCIEMRTERPWTYQTDLFGLAGTIHVVLFGSYMKVYQEHGEWKTTGNFVRKWNVPLWKNLFKVLLNVPSCHQQPDLAELRKPFENYFMEKISNYNKWRFSMIQTKRTL